MPAFTGFSGMGFKISPAVGLAMAKLIVGGKATTVDISAFRPDRFAVEAPIVAPYPYADDKGTPRRGFHT